MDLPFFIRSMEQSITSPIPLPTIELLHGDMRNPSHGGWHRPERQDGVVRESASWTEWREAGVLDGPGVRTQTRCCLRDVSAHCSPPRKTFAEILPRVWYIIRSSSPS